jgi:hypothetical protein
MTIKSLNVGQYDSGEQCGIWTSCEYLPFKGEYGRLFEETWIPFTSVICTTCTYIKLDWNLPTDFGKEVFQWTCIYTLLLLSRSPWRRLLIIYSNKLEYPLPKDDLCQVWWKLVQLFWRSLADGQWGMWKAHLRF